MILYNYLILFYINLLRYVPDPRQPGNDRSPQGSVSEELTRQKMSYTESAPREPRPGSRTSSQSSSMHSSERQPESLSRMFGENEASSGGVPAQGASSMPRQPAKSKENSEFMLVKGPRIFGVAVSVMSSIEAHVNHYLLDLVKYYVFRNYMILIRYSMLPQTLVFQFSGLGFGLSCGDWA